MNTRRPERVKPLQPSTKGKSQQHEYLDTKREPRKAGPGDGIVGGLLMGLQRHAPGKGCRNRGAVVRGLGGDYDNDDKEEDMGLTKHQNELLTTIYEQVTGTYDPTGRGMELNDHDHIKWVAKQCADNAAAIKAVDAKLDKLIEKLG